MKIPCYIADAFAEGPLRGNPAAVCVTEAPLPAPLMQRIAEENNLPETAFLVRRQPGCYALRWFTPEQEVDLCGHATLASAFVLSCVLKETDSPAFYTRSGELRAQVEDGLVTLDFPARPGTPSREIGAVTQALGAVPAELYLARDYLAVFPKEEDVRLLAPDWKKLAALRGAFAVIATAPGEECDFVSRFFIAECGGTEDPVTGSAHCTLVPYWAQRLQKQELSARQLSRRGGALLCRDCGERVSIGGRAVLYARGEIELPAGLLPDEATQAK